MSYNISAWKTIEMKDLIVPLESLRYSAEYRQRGYHVRYDIEFENNDIIVVVKIADGGRITGILNPDRSLLIRNIEWITGEGSGTAYHEVIIPALKHSEGFLRALVVWEGGDIIEYLEARDGIVVEKPFSA